MALESPAPGRKTVLIVEDDPGTRRVLASGLATTLGMFDVLTAEHGQEAVDVLDRQAVDVVVTDLAMPIMDGFALIGALSNRAAAPPVVVLSALAPNTVAEGLDGYSGLTVLRKPAGYPEVARAVLDALERHALGQVAGIPLASVLQLVEAERRSCTLAVASGRRRGRLYFESGRLVNAFSEDFGADGEAAAYDILSWERTAIEFERLPDAVRRTIQLSTQALLIEVARRQDATRATPVPPSLAPAGNGAAPAVVTSSDGAASARADGSSDDHAQADHAPDDAPQAAETAADGASTPAVAAEAAAPTEPVADAVTASTEPVKHEPAPAADPPEPLLAEATAAGSTGPDGMPDLFAADPEASTPVAAPDLAAAPPAEPAPAPSAYASSETGTGERPALDLEVPTAGAPDLVAGPAGDLPTAAPPPAPAPATAASATGAAGTAAPPPGGPHAALVEAIERLTRRVLDADAALAAVSEEVVAFREAQRRYDEAAQREDQRRHAVAEARRDVARLAHQILERMDGLFALEGGDDVEADGTALHRP